MRDIIRPSADPVIKRKLDRLRGGAAPRVLDLFSGCGGISLGFEAAGFEITAAAEIDELAAASHARNFHDSDPVHARPRDLTKLEPAALAAELDLGPVEDAFDIVVGGPPCQAYARVGRAKLREVQEHPEAFRIDPRASLFLRYLAYIAETKPVAVMMENVPDLLNHAGHNIADEVCEALEDMGYDARYSLLNASHHGVPQMRDRVILIAIHRDAGAEIRFPAATHHCDLPVGYSGTRAVALKHVDRNDGRWVEPDTGSEDLPPAVSARDAIGDLPSITLHLEGKLKRGARRFDQEIAYPAGKVGPYAALMRSWPGHESETGVWDHVIRYLPRDSGIFAAMKEGDEYPAAHRVATKLFEAEAKRRGIASGSNAWNELHRSMVPPYPVGTFPNRWGKLRSDRPARTLMAHLGKDCYSHIHYDDAQARVISVREAARLQSFPDGFTFTGTMNPAYRQIGNAVPPLLAKAVATEIRRSLSDALAASPVIQAAE